MKFTAPIMMSASVLSLVRRSAAFAPSVAVGITRPRGAVVASRSFAAAQAGSAPTGDGNPDRPKRISDDIEKMLLEQAQLEHTASLTYLAMSYWFDKRGMQGFRDHFREQSEEERGHSIEFLDYVNKRGGTAKILSLPEPATDFTSPAVAMTYYLDLERKVADSINEKYEKAHEARDWPTKGFLQKFVDYQVEEEEEADGLAEEMYRLTKKGDLSQLLDIEQRKRN